MKRYVKSSSYSQVTWSKPFVTNEYSIYDNSNHKVSTAKFDDGSTGVVFYDDASYILFDANGRYVDGDVGSNVRDAKYRCEDFYYTL